jgi:RNA polymerase sigma-70 factor, ECF subfamily
MNYVRLRAMEISERLWQEYHAKLRSFIRGKVSDDAASDDILQTVFLKVHSSLASLKDGAKLESWLYRITRNAITDYFRSRKPFVDIPEWLPQPETDSVKQVTRELSECLQPFIQMLPEKYREAIILSELKGLTHKEIVELQGISLSNAKSRVQRGRVLLKNMFTECCRFEFDHSGRLCDYEPKGETCSICNNQQ